MDYLVTLAPQRIVLCYRGGSINPRMVDTLRRIFPNRVQEMRLTPSCLLYTSQVCGRAG